MEFISFASGSSGNCGLIRGGGVTLLLDAGISLKRIRGCLADRGLELGDLNGVLVTHEHTDHISGLPMLAKYSGVPVYLSGGTARAVLRQGKCPQERLRILACGETLELGELRIRGFDVPHDAAEPFGYRIEGETGALAVVTDLGYAPRSVREAVAGCTAAVLEANYDRDLLRTGPYPWTLKQRIQGMNGHLGNPDAAELALGLLESGTKEILLAHLSKENNQPELAYSAVRERVKDELRLHVAPRDACSCEMRI
jgi:phosphoribosyl 1,2-cyclic phosphodiesterase